MVRIDLLYRGELRCEAVHGPSSTVVVTDAPVDNQGKGESFSPTDLVATALGTCMLTLMGIAAARHGWDLAGTTAQVEKQMVADPERRIGKLAVVIHFNRVFEPAQRQVLERAALTCPVSRSLHPDVQVPVKFVDPKPLR